ncbi:MAG: YggS family pyridoxal phosphate-dependent enzyme [Clostridia bacterium]|nr:YggS family pyridoxal phosphate-dependent enzyme [Clostridia bacterium]
MLKSNLDKVFNQIKDGNNLGEPISLVGASKTMSVEVINQAISLGLKIVAENKVQEFRLKTEKIIGGTQHFIGHLQTNKAKYLVGRVDLIHSVDSIKLAEEIDRLAKNRNVIQDVLVEINCGGELSKSGFDLSTASPYIEEIINKFDNVKVKGLMTMLPNSDDKEHLTLLCQKMRALYDDLKKKHSNFCYLSMGMSNDYLIAIKNGSNMIRLGRTIFGERNYGDNV